MMRFRMAIVLARRLLLRERGRVGRLLLRERWRVGRLLLASLVAVACNCCADSWCGIARLSITRVVTIGTIARWLIDISPRVRCLKYDRSRRVRDARRRSERALDDRGVCIGHKFHSSHTLWRAQKRTVTRTFPMALLRGAGRSGRS